MTKHHFYDTFTLLTVPIVYRLGHILLKDGSGVRFSVGSPGLSFQHFKELAMTSFKKFWDENGGKLIIALLTLTVFGLAILGADQGWW